MVDVELGDWWRAVGSEGWCLVVVGAVGGAAEEVDAYLNSMFNNLHQS